VERVAREIAEAYLPSTALSDGSPGDAPRSSLLR
jgi:hypothetical protein